MRAFQIAALVETAVRDERERGIIRSKALEDAARQALEALMWHDEGMRTRADSEAITALRAALAEPVLEPVAWSHNLIDNIITHRPADIDRHPDRWTALYPEPRPCPTCEALARTVMMDQTGYDPAPAQRKPLTGEEIDKIAFDCLSSPVFEPGWNRHFARAVEEAHGIKENP